MKGSVAATWPACSEYGAVCIIFAFRSGGLPTYVMPLVFAGAPLVNVLFSMWLHPPGCRQILCFIWDLSCCYRRGVGPVFANFMKNLIGL